MRGPPDQQIISEEPEVGAWTWTPDEMTEIEKLVCAETPTTREEIGTTDGTEETTEDVAGTLHCTRPNTKTTRTTCTMRVGEEQNKA